MALHLMRRLVIPLAGLAAYARWGRPRLLRWGAAEDEARRWLPGDGLVPGATGRSTQAITLEASPREIWPWLVQMGCQRAGWYSYDRLDNRGIPSADRILPELQHLKVGDRLPSTPDGKTWFDVVELKPERALVLRATLDPVHGRMVSSGQRPGRYYMDGTWAFVLEPLDGGRRTRLLVRTQGTGGPGFLWKPFNLLFGELAHFIMQRKQLRNLKRRVEGMAAHARAARAGPPLAVEPSAPRPQVH